MVYKQVRIDITKPQLAKALQGKSIRITKDQIGKGTSYLSLHPANVKIVERAAMKGCGCTCTLTEGELLSTCEDMKGEGIFGDIWKGLKSGYDWVKKNIIDTEIYQKAVKPLVRGAVDQVSGQVKSKLPQVSGIVDLATNELGKQTGAFGIQKGRKSKTQRNEMLRAKGLYLS